MKHPFLAFMLPQGDGCFQLLSKCESNPGSVQGTVKGNVIHLFPGQHTSSFFEQLWQWSIHPSNAGSFVESLSQCMASVIRAAVGPMQYWIFIIVTELYSLSSFGKQSSFCQHRLNKIVSQIDLFLNYFGNLRQFVAVRLQKMVRNC